MMADRFEARTLHKNDGQYPSLLSAVLGRDAPQRLEWIGNLSLLSRPSVGFCGSRKASAKGLETAADCAAQAAECGVVVVSGYAAGVDETAHFQALAKNGSTIIVLPEGISYFRVRRELRDVWDWDRVLVLSQFSADERWQSFRAMARNKVIIGLSDAMIVIEAGETGGTMDAGRSTLRYGQPLFVAQYEEVTQDALGNKYLIELGARPLSRLRSTGRANMVRVWEAFAARDDGPRQRAMI
jgi:DNA processing protein